MRANRRICGLCGRAFAIVLLHNEPKRKRDKLCGRLSEAADAERLVNPRAGAPSTPTTPAASSEAAVELAPDLPVRHDEPSRVS